MSKAFYIKVNRNEDHECQVWKINVLCGRGFPCMIKRLGTYAMPNANIIQLSLTSLWLMQVRLVILV